MIKKNSRTCFRRFLSAGMKRFRGLPDGTFAAIQISLVRNITGLPFSGTDSLSAGKLSGRIECLLDAQAVLDDWTFVPAENLSDGDYEMLAAAHIFDEPCAADIVIPPEKAFPGTAIFSNLRDNLQFVFCGNENDAGKLFAQYEKLAKFAEKLEKNLHFEKNERLGYLTSSPEMIGNALSIQALLHLPALLCEDKMRYVVSAAGALGVRIRGCMISREEPGGAYFTLETAHMLGMTPREQIFEFSNFCKKICDLEKASREKIKTDKAFFMRVQHCFAQAKIAAMLAPEEALNVLAVLLLGADCGFFDKKSRLELEETVPVFFKKNQKGGDTREECGKILCDAVSLMEAPKFKL